MNQSERNNIQQIQGIVRMVYDLCEKVGALPTANDYYVAIRDWLECEQTPTPLTMGIVDTCSICDKQIVYKDYPICNDCDYKGNSYEKEIQ